MGKRKRTAGQVLLTIFFLLVQTLLLSSCNNNRTTSYTQSDENQDITQTDNNRKDSIVSILYLVDGSGSMKRWHDIVISFMLYLSDELKNQLSTSKGIEIKTGVKLLYTDDGLSDRSIGSEETFKDESSDIYEGKQSDIAKMIDKAIDELRSNANIVVLFTDFDFQVKNVSPTRIKLELKDITNSINEFLREQKESFRVIIFSVKKSHRLIHGLLFAKDDYAVDLSSPKLKQVIQEMVSDISAYRYEYRLHDYQDFTYFAMSQSDSYQDEYDGESNVVVEKPILWGLADYDGYTCIEVCNYNTFAISQENCTAFIAQIYVEAYGIWEKVLKKSTKTTRFNEDYETYKMFNEEGEAVYLRPNYKIELRDSIPDVIRYFDLNLCEKMNKDVCKTKKKDYYSYFISEICEIFVEHISELKHDECPYYLHLNEVANCEDIEEL